MDRRQFLRSSICSSIGLGLAPWSCTSTSNTQSTTGKPSKFFTTAKKEGRWWLLTPDDQLFWSIGMNHVDPASLRYTDSGNMWEETYLNDMEKWLAVVKQDLTSWGFNTLGWNQEVVTINNQNHRHSRSFTFEEYQWLNMPYCHMLPFIESHQWEIETHLPEIRSKGFAEWCDYVARDQCARMKDDPHLIGYFFTDCPTWVHHNGLTAWKAPIFDPDMLNSEVGRKELFNLASTYYRVITESIRRYDPNHLILGDRYEANHLLPEEIVKAALPYVDIFSFQCFGKAEVVKERLEKWANVTNKPVLLADNAQWVPPIEKGWPPKKDRHVDPIEYEHILQTLQEMPNAIGYHLCGAYIRNKVRRYGLKNHQDEIDSSTKGIQEANLKIHEWIQKQG